MSDCAHPDMILDFYQAAWILSLHEFMKMNAWVLHGLEAFTGKASKGEVVALYFEPLATQHVEASGPPEG